MPEARLAKKKTKVLFMKYHEAADQQPLSQKAAEKLGIFPSLALAQLAAWLRQHGYPVGLIDLHAENIYPADAGGRVREFGPDIVCLTAKTLGWPAVIEIAQMIKIESPHSIVVVGGPHLSIYPEESLTWECFDIAVLGDGEETLLELVDRFESGSELHTCPGTVARDPATGEIIRNAPGKIRKNLDEYPMPAFDLMPMSKYHALTVLMPMATMVTTRGCPWHCGYCSQVYSDKLRFRSPELVAEEMQLLEKNHGVREIVFFDETFTIGKRRMRKLAEEILRRNLKVKFNIRARVDTVDREVLTLLRRAGLRSIHMGVEAGTDRVLKIMNKQITREQTERAFRIAREVGIETRGYFMIGYYDATPDDIEDTINFASGLGLDWASFSVATALPATELYDIARERGYVSGDFWRQYTIDGGGNIPQLETETFTAEQLRAYRTKAYMKFYLRSDLIRRKLSKADTRAELVEIVGGASVLGEIVKSTVMRRVPKVGLGKWATV